jgi:hypothetical protein
LETASAEKDNINVSDDKPSSTSVRLFIFDKSSTASLRSNCRKQKATIAAAVITAALAAVRILFEESGSTKKFPDYQSWVVTASTRHLLPNSKLLEGGDKESDPSLLEFGGYGGSISNEHFKLKGSSELWERCRNVKKHLTGSFLKSMRRLKLMNFVFRRPKLLMKLKKRINVKDMTRIYSVEVANLGAWTSAYAPGTNILEELASVDTFAGTLNNSFEGARALFTIALISIDDIMSFSVAFDNNAVSNEEGDKFGAILESILRKMSTSPESLKLSSLEIK